MSTEHESRLGHRAWLRIGLLYLAATTLNGSLWALPFPRSFYDDFPLPGREWVSALGPYNEHLIRDYGALSLALGVLLVLAGIFLDRRLVQSSLIAWLGWAVPHFVFHVAQVHFFSTLDNLAQLGGLGFEVLLPLALLALTGARGGPKSLRSRARREVPERGRIRGRGDHHPHSSPGRLPIVFVRVLRVVHHPFRRHTGADKVVR